MIEKCTLEYVDACDFPEAAQNALGEWSSTMGIGNGTYESVAVGEHGDDSLIESWIGSEKTEIVYNALREVGFTDGETICIHFEW